MVYRFNEDRSGHVVVEARRDDLNAYLGLHFRASDIPAPARRLFALSPLRHLPDVSFVPVRVVPETAQPVDTSRSVLRHVSTMYSDYLKNMGVHATMVLPMVKAGQLWGLMSCMHHAGPMHVGSKTSTAVKLLTHLVSSMMAEREDSDTAAYRERMHEAVNSLNLQMLEEPEFQYGLIRGDVTILGCLGATGGAVVAGYRAVRLGTTPNEREVRGIVDWLDTAACARPDYATNCLSKVYPPAAAFTATPSGLLAGTDNAGPAGIRTMVRPERAEAISWAGDRHAQVQAGAEDGEQRLPLQGSFETWKEEVRGRSAAWLPCEIEAAAALRRAIVAVALTRLNQELRNSNTELESFAFAASHDLKEPLRGIHNFTNFLGRSADTKLTEEERGRLTTILRLTERMDRLTDALLDYSRIGRMEAVLEVVDMNELVHQVIELLDPQLTAAGTEVRLPRPFPLIRTDRVRLIAAMTNLVVNAIKDRDLPAGERWIEIGWRHLDGRRLFYVSDNGIGIASQHLEQMFQIFRRLTSPRDEYGGGNGAGLTIAPHH